MRILFVALAHPEANWLYKAMQESGHSLVRSDDVRDGVFLSGQERFDAIVLMSGENDGCRHLHTVLPDFIAQGAGAALVVVLGTAATVQDRVNVLRAGADACYGHPYSFLEIHERLMALQRTALAAPEHQASTEEFDDLLQSLSSGHLRAALTPRERLLLECLIRQPDTPVSREQLMRYAWPDNDDVDPASVNHTVSRLRRKLESSELPIRIDTVSRFGYRLVRIE